MNFKKAWSNSENEVNMYDFELAIGGIGLISAMVLYEHFHLLISDTALGVIIALAAAITAAFVIVAIFTALISLSLRTAAIALLYLEEKYYPAEREEGYKK